MHSENNEFSGVSSGGTNIGNIGLLSLVNELKSALESFSKKIEDLEYQNMEKDEKIQQMELEISSLKSNIEKKDMENFRLDEEIKASKEVLSQLVEKLGK